MTRIAKILVALFFFKLILFLIARGFTLEVIERFYENNNKL